MGSERGVSETARWMRDILADEHSSDPIGVGNLLGDERRQPSPIPTVEGTSGPGGTARPTRVQRNEARAARRMQEMMDPEDDDRPVPLSSAQRARIEATVGRAGDTLDRLAAAGETLRQAIVTYKTREVPQVLAVVEQLYGPQEAKGVKLQMLGIEDLEDQLTETREHIKGVLEDVVGKVLSDLER